MTRTDLKAVVLGIMLLVATGCGARSPRSVTSQPSKAQIPGWFPTSTDVTQVTFTLDQSAPAATVQLAGPVPIYPTRHEGQSLIERLLGMLAKGKAVRTSSSGGPL